MIKTITVAGGISLAAALSYFGGNLVFGIIVEGTWIAPLIFGLLPDAWADAIFIALLWVCRIVVFNVIFFAFTEAQRLRNPQPAHRD